MRRAGLALALSCLMFAGCWSGPKQLTRSVDDWDNQLYVQSPWMDSLLWHVVPFFPVMKIAAGIGDILIVNPVSFWFEDAWDGKGTGFQHLDVEPTDGEMRSLMMDDSEVMNVVGR